MLPPPPISYLCASAAEPPSIHMPPPIPVRPDTDGGSSGAVEVALTAAAASAPVAWFRSRAVPLMSSTAGTSTTEMPPPTEAEQSETEAAPSRTTARQEDAAIPPPTEEVDALGLACPGLG